MCLICAHGAELSHAKDCGSKDHGHIARDGVARLELMNPLLVYGLVALGGIGVALALPRKALGPQLAGAVIAAAAGGIMVLLLTLKGVQSNQFTNIYFYIFGAIALGGALRVITHAKPVYAALYFILTILATAGLFLILSAEFMAFALIIVYAGAILITYLFVIMLATQAPEENVEYLAEYDVKSREPIVATVVGFVLLGVLTALMFRGSQSLPVAKADAAPALLTEMPRKVERVLKENGLLQEGERVEMVGSGDVARMNMDLEGGTIAIMSADGSRRMIERAVWPEELKTLNIEALGFNLLRDHPGAIEIAGVILLMAMLGAVVLSRKQVQIDEELKMQQAQKLGMSMDVSPSAPVQSAESLAAQMASNAAAKAEGGA